MKRFLNCAQLRACCANSKRTYSSSGSSTGGLTNGYPQPQSGMFKPRRGIKLRDGGEISAGDLQIKYTIYGDPKCNPSVLIFPSMSNSCYVSEHPDVIQHLAEHPSQTIRRNNLGGPWWSEVVSYPSRSNMYPGINLEEFAVISADSIGSPYQSSNVLNTEGFPSASLTPQDQAQMYKILLEELGIDKVYAICGSSMGGMVALQFAALFPDCYQRLIAIACTAQTSPSTIALRTVQRRCVESLREDTDGTGMKIARMIGMICYRSRAEFDDRFEWASPEITSYLDYHATHFASHYNPDCYLCLSQCMDKQNLGFGFDSFENGVMRIPVDKEVMLLAYSSDYLIPSSELQRLAAILGSRSKARVYFETLNSIYGHDSFMIDQKQISYRIKPFLEDAGIDSVRRAVDEMHGD